MRTHLTAGLLKRDGAKKNGRWVVSDIGSGGLMATGEPEVPYTRTGKTKP
jgi:hypothetical protein